MPDVGNEGLDLSALRVTGTQVNYYVLCPRKLWWFSHGMEQERDYGNVELGRMLHEQSYPGQERKDLMIDDLLRLDFTESGAVHEVKKSKGGERAALFQLLYYLYYLKHEKGIERTGVIDYPKLRRREEVQLTPELEIQVEEILRGVEELRESTVPPAVAKPMTICGKCAYQELCWG